MMKTPRQPLLLLRPTVLDPRGWSVAVASPVARPSRRRGPCRRAATPAPPHRLAERFPLADEDRAHRGGEIALVLRGGPLPAEDGRGMGSVRLGTRRKKLQPSAANPVPTPRSRTSRPNTAVGPVSLARRASATQNASSFRLASRQGGTPTSPPPDPRPRPGPGPRGRGAGLRRRACWLVLGGQDGPDGGDVQAGRVRAIVRTARTSIHPGRRRGRWPDAPARPPADTGPARARFGVVVVRRSFARGPPGVLVVGMDQALDHPRRTLEVHMDDKPASARCSCPKTTRASPMASTVLLAARWRLVQRRRRAGARSRSPTARR